ncbi:MAG: ATP-grasp domain-containing protein [Bacteroidales bacterium]|nr:ATP-grasp domain-containing protein [Bacteroidales bacterium]MCM1415661.1 ATP-grasp domain-containing protein [bacterium]MCM1423907.1 ATP-grasp domain-containing protein [bacterium]
MHKLYWVGPRESDIHDIKSMFAGSITIYGSNCGNNVSYCRSNIDRINHNIQNNDCDAFMQERLKELIREDDSVRFLFYNSFFAYDFDQEIVQHSICVNKYDLLEKLHDKTKCRAILQETVKTIPFINLLGRECTYDHCCDYFDAEEFVIQEAFSSGGEGTVHFGKFDSLDFIDQNKQYLVSPYIENSISLNTHIVIGEEKVCYFPPSVQIVKEIGRRMLYLGADYISYTYLDSKIRDEVRNNSILIGKKLQLEGYRGVLGIDFLLKNDNLYFMEVNPRFQASSQLLNMALITAGQNALQELHIRSFMQSSLEDIPALSVPFSNFSFTSGNIHCDRIGKIINSDEAVMTQKDGFDVEQDLPDIPNVYLFRMVFDTNITSITRNELSLHPNLYTEDITPYIDPAYEWYKPNVKIALLNHGVSLTVQAIEYARKCGTIREAVFDAVDIVIFDSVYVNVPYNCKFCTFSPFTIDIQNDNFVLVYNGNYISNVEISFVPETLLNKTNTFGVPLEHILNLANDRIRINPAPVCVFKKQNTACKFCNLPEENSSYDIESIKDAVDYCLKEVPFRHFLIGGGTYSVQGGWDVIIEITKYIRSKSDKKIYLMSIPPKDTKILDDLYHAGITEVAFNMEIFDRDLALEIMPGKGKIDEKTYYSAFDEAIKLWGNTGNVRSLLIYGFDSRDVFLKGIEALCQKGVEPIISIFRPLKGTALAHLNPPPTVELFSLYQNCRNIAHKYSLILGPDCIKCQNNTLSYTEK